MLVEEETRETRERLENRSRVSLPHDCPLNRNILPFYHHKTAKQQNSKTENPSGYCPCIYPELPRKDETRVRRENRPRVSPRLEE
ncbi:MAG: hypothetical protein PHE66_06360 [Syntrophaceticus schinkii]|nr:hypothetical protein [Syntrophaceticus schinkii]